MHPSELCIGRHRTVITLTYCHKYLKALGSDAVPEMLMLQVSLLTQATRLTPWS